MSSARPIENENPALVVASALKPNVASIRVLPMSQGLGIDEGAGLFMQSFEGGRFRLIDRSSAYSVTPALRRLSSRCSSSSAWR